MATEEAEKTSTDVTTTTETALPLEEWCDLLNDQDLLQMVLDGDSGIARTPGDTDHPSEDADVDPELNFYPTPDGTSDLPSPATLLPIPAADLLPRGVKRRNAGSTPSASPCLSSSSPSHSQGQSHSEDNEEETIGSKQHRKREKNKVHARESRQRHKAFVERLQDESTELKSRNVVLEAENSLLKEQVSFLQSLLRGASSAFPDSFYPAKGAHGLAHGTRRAATLFAVVLCFAVFFECHGDMCCPRLPRSAPQQSKSNRAAQALEATRGRTLLSSNDNEGSVLFSFPKRLYLTAAFLCIVWALFPSPTARIVRKFSIRVIQLFKRRRLETKKTE